MFFLEKKYFCILQYNLVLRASSLFYIFDKSAEKKEETLGRRLMTVYFFCFLNLSTVCFQFSFSTFGMCGFDRYILTILSSHYLKSQMCSLQEAKIFCIKNNNCICTQRNFPKKTKSSSFVWIDKFMAFFTTLF